MDLSNRRPIAITPGDPAGIGPDIVVKLLQKSLPFPLVIVADQHLLEERADQLKIKWCKYPHISICHIPLASPSHAGVPNPENATYVLKTLSVAVENCLSKNFSALVTGPVNKALINQAGFSFTGHTQFLAQLTHTSHTVMMLTTKNLKVALLTTHIPLAKVAETITEELIIRSVKIIIEDLTYRFAISEPRILVCGLNPHAGESGHIGHEEQTTIIPALNKLRQQGCNVIGPVSADTAFIPQQLEQADVVLALFHDQGLPVLKFHGFGEAVNVTLGLPIIRTSVDHGTAYDIAGTGKADPTSLFTALQLAVKMTSS